MEKNTKSKKVKATSKATVPLSKKKITSQDRDISDRVAYVSDQEVREIYEEATRYNCSNRLNLSDY